MKSYFLEIEEGMKNLKMNIFFPERMAKVLVIERQGLVFASVVFASENSPDLSAEIGLGSSKALFKVPRGYSRKGVKAIVWQWTS